MKLNTHGGFWAVLALLLTCLPASGQIRPEVTQPPNKPAASKPAVPKTTQIVIQTSPEAQVYLDDVFKGQASRQGRLVIENPKAGDHTLRVALAGRKDFEQQITLKPGQTINIRAAIQDVTGADEKAKKELPRIESPQATTGTLLISADAPCNLSMDGQESGELVPGTLKRVSVPFGDHLLHAVSKEETSASVDWIGKVSTPEQRLVQLSLADKIAKVRVDRKAEEAAGAAEVVLWKSIENSARIEDFRAYLQKYPNGTFATVASGRIGKLEADARTKEAEDARKRQEDEKQAENKRYTFPVSHLHARVTLSSNPGGFGHLRITPDGASYEGDDASATFSKNDVTLVDIARTGAADFLRLHTASGSWSFAPIDEADVQNRKFKGSYPPAKIGNAIVERWGFVGTHNNKWLVPPSH